MSTLDIVSRFAPGFAARYALNQYRYNNIKDISGRAKDAQRLYEAATQSQYKKGILGGGSSPDRIVAQAGSKLRDIARHLEENHDLTNAIFDDLLNNIVGDGVRVTPMMRNRSGDLAVDANERLLDLWHTWTEYPETTGEYGFEQVERHALRHMLRDGEIFIQDVISNTFQYRTDTPYVMNLIDADYCPLNLIASTNRILHGIAVDEWSAPTRYYFHKSHPGDIFQTTSQIGDMLEVPASQVTHLKYTKRLRQRRGVPLIHSVLNRLQDVKDYEDSERIAAKVSADITGFIKKSTEVYGSTDVNNDGNREMQMAAGAIFELAPGEDMGIIKSDRPNTGLVPFRKAMMQAVAGGTGTRASSITRDYDNTYSAQRQELVEATIGYRVHFAYLQRRFYQPVFNKFIEAARLSGQLSKVLRDVDPATLTRVEFRAPPLPWIDPLKEAKAWIELVNAKLESPQEVIRSRGRDPQKVFDEIAEAQEAGVTASFINAADVDVDDVVPGDNDQGNQGSDDAENAA